MWDTYLENVQIHNSKVLRPQGGGETLSRVQSLPFYRFQVHHHPLAELSPKLDTQVAPTCDKCPSLSGTGQWGSVLSLSNQKTARPGHSSARDALVSVLQSDGKNQVEKFQFIQYKIQGSASKYKTPLFRPLKPYPCQSLAGAWKQHHFLPSQCTLLRQTQTSISE